MNLPILGIIILKMGINDIEPIGLANALFSKVQQRVLALIFGRPQRSFYTSEIVRNVRSGVGAVERELRKLEKSGLVKVKRIGNQKHYRANEAAPIFEDLRGLVEKTVGLAAPIKNSLEPYAATIATAFVYGSAAKGCDTADSDIDLVVIGDDLNYSDLYTAVQNAERKLRRKLHPLFFSQDGWRRKTCDKESVFGKISRSPKIFIIGSENDFKNEQTGTR